MAGGDKCGVVPVSVEQIGEEETAEEHDFGQEEQPHAEASRLALLSFRLEVMAVLRQRNVRVVPWDSSLVRVRMCGHRVIQRSFPRLQSCAQATRSHTPHD